MLVRKVQSAETQQIATYRRRRKNSVWLLFFFFVFVRSFVYVYVWVSVNVEMGFQLNQLLVRWLFMLTKERRQTGTEENMEYEEKYGTIHGNSKICVCFFLFPIFG